MAKSSTAKRAAATTANAVQATKATKATTAKATKAEAKATTTRTATAERPKASNTATIKIDKGAGHRGKVDVGANGRFYKVPVDEEVEVNGAVLNALRDSHVKFTTISPLAGEDVDEGSSASSTVEHTAIRGEPVEDDKTAKPDETPHELVQEDEDKK